MDINKLEELAVLFKAQFPSLFVGGLYNPTVEYEDAREIHLRCFYDNYNSEDDSWHWYYDKEAKRFYN